ncbi:lasso RiPP family leader peptide-containing protein [Streptomyces sp. NPDC053048]
MNETPLFEPADVYVPPLLHEVGDFAELTRGNIYGMPEGPAGGRFIRS